MLNEQKKKQDEIFKLIDSKLSSLNCSVEDTHLIKKLAETYFRKRTGVSSSQPKTTAGGILWAYSKVNFLWEGNHKWSRQGLADLFGASAKTVGDKAAEIHRALKIQLWDERFAREDVANRSPFKNMVVTPSGMIVPKNMIPENIYCPPLRKGKEDYVYGGLELLDEGYIDEALKHFKKALAIDERYIDAYDGIGNAYFLEENYEKAKEYYQKAYTLTKERFKEGWPSTLEWGILENRPYLRAICGFGLCFWKNNNFEEAKRYFALLLKLNPKDDQGARFILAALYENMSFVKFDELEDEANEKGNYDKIEALFQRQNEIHKFWK
jgi:tetratricopeptide (TPR) repeat protein